MNDCKFIYVYLLQPISPRKAMATERMVSLPSCTFLLKKEIRLESALNLWEKLNLHTPEVVCMQRGYPPT